MTCPLGGSALELPRLRGSSALSGFADCGTRTSADEDTYVCRSVTGILRERYSVQEPLALGLAIQGRLVEDQGAAFLDRVIDHVGWHTAESSCSTSEVAGAAHVVMAGTDYWILLSGDFFKIDSTLRSAVMFSGGADAQASSNLVSPWIRAMSRMRRAALNPFVRSARSCKWSPLIYSNASADGALH